MIKATVSLFEVGCLFKNLIFSELATLNIVLMPRAIEKNRNM
jgi:hypothetical protein